ncbi:MAG: DNA/RNA non-specific endonuclease [Gemmatimonadaceae bacterium]
MNSRTWRAALLAAAFAILSCSAEGSLNPVDGAESRLEVSAALSSVRISEFHYDNTGTDADETIEVSGPAGTDLTGWQLVLYNGNGGAAYDTKTLSGAIPATCSPRGVVLQTYPSNGIQNGSPDGIALVDALGAVVEFLSYEGVMTAVGGPANGLTSTDVGVSENGTEPPGQSLQRDGSGTWSAPATSTFGACNDDGTPPPPPVVTSVTVSPATATIGVGATQQFSATAFDASNQPISGVVFTWSSANVAAATVSSNGLATGVAAGSAQITATAPNAVAGSATLTVTSAPPPGLPDTRISEVHYDNLGTDTGEAIEIEGSAGTDLTGWQLVLYNGSGGAPYNTQSLAGAIANSCSGRGVIAVNYPQDGLQNGSPDGMALVNAGGTVVEFLSYEGSFTAVGGPANGMVSTDIGVAESSSPIGQSLQRDGTGAWSGPAAASIGACNGSPPPPVGNSITFTGRTASDPALPVGFEDQLFAIVRDANGNVVVTTITWTSETPALASIDADGVVAALGAGTAILRATAADGFTTATVSLATRIASASPTAVYAGNAEFGEPADADASDDFILRHAQFTTSYNRNRGTPNWVSYDLEATHFGVEDRCDCFTFDPALPASFTRLTTANYTGAGTFHGYGIDRGHLARSFDRTSGSLDNAFTFYFSNIIPQAADQNQGPWAAMETFLGDMARFQNKEVYIIAGVAGTKGTVKNEGKIVIPASTWKVAVVMPRDQGLANVLTPQDAQVIAAIMPNDPGVRNVDWNTYRTTVDAVEALSGYNLLALLPDQIEIALESNTSAPVAVVNGPFTGNEGASVSMTAAGSTDPDGHALTYQWDFGDASTGAGLSTTHTYAQDGLYTVRLTVTDVLGLANTVTTTATISNVAPAIGALSDATLIRGETYTASGSFTDPGADAWTATVDYGAGAGAIPLTLTGKTFTVGHTYAQAGTFTTTVRIADDDATSTATVTITVLTPSQAVVRAIALVDGLVAAGKLKPGPALALETQLDIARRLLDLGKEQLAVAPLLLVRAQVDLLVSQGRLSAADAAPLRALLDRIIRSISAP